MEEKSSVFRALFEKYREIIMYCVFGLTTTIVNWLFYSIFETILSATKMVTPEIEMLMAGVLAWIIAVAVAFVTNKLWVFESKSWERELVKKEALTFFGGRIATGILEVLAVPALVSWGFDIILFGVDGLPAKIVASVAIVILNYILSKFISFRGSNESTDK